MRLHIKEFECSMKASILHSIYSVKGTMKGLCSWLCPLYNPQFDFFNPKVLVPSEVRQLT